MTLKRNFDVTKFFIALILIFLTIQLSSWFLAQFTDMEMLKAGWILFLFLSVSAIVSTFVLGKKLGSLDKKDIIFILIEFLIIVGLFYYLPKLIPEIFSSYSLEIREPIKNLINSFLEYQAKII